MIQTRNRSASPSATRGIGQASDASGLHEAQNPHISVYQRLFERLSWIENRVSTLGEAPIPELKDLEAGMVLFGHNSKTKSVLETQKQNFEWFGWKTPEALRFAWQYTDDENEESPESYLRAIEEFHEFLRHTGDHDARPTQRSSKTRTQSDRRKAPSSAEVSGRGRRPPRSSIR
jgi:hypothetical protein